MDRKYSITELSQLSGLANKYISDHGDGKMEITKFYRNKPEDYFDDILVCENGIMKPYLKYFNGDCRCPINGKLKGLFFAGKCNKMGEIPKKSPFGDTRLILPVSDLFTDEHNLYFADFYCNQNHGRKLHYVTVVITKPGRIADRICRRDLLQLNEMDNPYLTIDVNGCVEIARDVTVEIFYTDSIDITYVELINVHTFGKGTSSEMGIAKIRSCRICNL